MARTIMTYAVTADSMSASAGCARSGAWAPGRDRAQGNKSRQVDTSAASKMIKAGS